MDWAYDCKKQIEKINEEYPEFKLISGTVIELTEDQFRTLVFILFNHGVNVMLYHPRRNFDDEMGNDTIGLFIDTRRFTQR